MSAAQNTDLIKNEISNPAIQINPQTLKVHSTKYLTSKVFPSKRAPCFFYRQRREHHRRCKLDHIGVQWEFKAPPTEGHYRVKWTWLYFVLMLKSQTFATDTYHSLLVSSQYYHAKTVPMWRDRESLNCLSLFSTIYNENKTPALGNAYTCFRCETKTEVVNISVFFQHRPMVSRINGKLSPICFEWYGWT